jgi:hypothetical protein
MDILWTELQTEGIEVEETDMPANEFDALFGDKPVAFPVNRSNMRASGR